MSRRKRQASAGPHAANFRKPGAPPTRKAARLWCFRLLAVTLVPILFLAVLEMVLRLAGAGYPTSFLLPAKQHGRQMLVPNLRFGWRFFGPDYSRTPDCFTIPREKPPDTVRVFVFGESAAFGDPDPDFGLPRMLQAMLSLRYPGVHFEVVNAAMTAINSNTILPIARDCARANGDIWVIYMGNNEVVGPFGAGTVFGPKAPPLPVIRAVLAFKATRTGELLDELIRKLHPPPKSESDWGGMVMFLKNHVRADDPRLAAVYRNFEQNLKDILRAGRRHGVRIVLSTVAVNLKDCAPFGSEHRPELSDEQIARWQDLCRRGYDATKAGHDTDAVRFFERAAQIDDGVAEMQYVWAQACLAAGQTAEAQRRFSRARDLDVLRFRCDSRLNAIIRRVASGHERDGVLLADAAENFARHSPDGLPGRKYFYEHVHLTFDGNYLLARTVAVKVAMLLPENVRARVKAGNAWPSEDECAQRLAWSDWSRLAVLDDVLGRLTDPPFTYQINHTEQLDYLRHEAEALRQGAKTVLQQHQALFQNALTAAPEDPVLYSLLAKMDALAGETNGAAAAARKAVDLLPNSVADWMLLGQTLAQQGQYGQSEQALEQAFHLDPRNFWALQDLAQTYAKTGRRDEAMREYRRVIALKPRFGPAYLGLGQLLEQAGHKAEAEKNYHLALQNRLHRSQDLLTLARFCQNRGWYADAVTNYVEAIQLSPLDSALHLELGQCFEALGHHAEARQQYARAVELATNSVPARFLLGLELGRQKEPAQAAKQFRAVIGLMPDLLEARVNLGIALMQQGLRSQAMEQFQEVLRRDPTNAAASRNLRALEADHPAEPAR